jgi:hypothetical protein
MIIVMHNEDAAAERRTEMSPCVKGFGCRPFTEGATRTGAGVRKPPREETAGWDAAVVRQAGHGAMGI